MTLQVYEYKIKDKLVGSYKGSFTVKKDAPKKDALVKELKAKLVQEFLHE